MIDGNQAQSICQLSSHALSHSVLSWPLSGPLSCLALSWSLNALLGLWISWPLGALWLFVPLLDHSASSWPHRSQHPMAIDAAQGSAIFSMINPPPVLFTGIDHEIPCHICIGVDEIVVTVCSHTKERLF